MIALEEKLTVEDLFPLQYQRMEWTLGVVCTNAIKWLHVAQFESEYLPVLTLWQYAFEISKFTQIRGLGENTQKHNSLVD
jgi:hypothetical protein